MPLPMIHTEGKVFRQSGRALGRIIESIFISEELIALAKGQSVASIVDRIVSQDHRSFEVKLVASPFNKTVV